MKNLDFHIDSSPLHDASIEAKMDFDKVLNQVHSQTGSSGLTAIWTASISLVLLLSFSLGSLIEDATPKRSMNSQGNSTLLAETREEFVDTDKDLKTINATASQEQKTSAPVVISQISEEKYAMSVQVTEKPTEPRPNSSEQMSNTPSRSLTPVPLKKARLVPMERSTIESTKDLRISQSMNINVDLTTYASLKNKQHYYFELDTALTKDLDISLDDDWEEADLKHHPRKNRYNMILRNGDERRQIVVRLVVTDLKMKSDNKFQLFARLKDIL